MNDADARTDAGQGPYRSASVSCAPLPLPRRNLTSAVTGVAVVAAIAWVLPLALVFRMGAFPGSFDRATAGMCGLLSIHVLLVPFLGLRSAALARGRRLESAPYLLGLSLAPLAVGALAFALDARAVVASIEPWSGSGSWFGRNAGPIVASRLAALAPITWFASIVAASASAVVATGAATALAMIDHRRVGAPRGPVLETLLVGASWLVVSVALEGRAGVGARIGVAALAVLVASGAASARHAGDRQEAIGLLRTALVGAVAATMVVVLGERAVAALHEARLSTPDGYADPRWSASLVELAAARHASARSMLLAASGAAACFALPLGSILRGGARNVGMMKAATSVGLVVAFASVFGVVTAQRSFEHQLGEDLRGHNQLPLLRKAWRAKPMSRPHRGYGHEETRAPILAIAADGTTMGGLGTKALLASEPDTRFDVFVSTLLHRRRRGCGADVPVPLEVFQLIAPTADIPELGPSLDAFQSPPTITFDVALWEHEEAGLNHGGLGLISTGLPSARVYENATLHLPPTMSLAEEDAAARRRDMGDLFALVSCVSSLRLVPRPDDPMQRILEAVAALERDASVLGCVPRIELVVLRPSFRHDDPEVR